MWKRSPLPQAGLIGINWMPVCQFVRGGWLEECWLVDLASAGALWWGRAIIRIVFDSLLAYFKASLDKESTELLENRTSSVSVRCRFGHSGSATCFRTSSGYIIHHWKWGLRQSKWGYKTIRASCQSERFVFWSDWKSKTDSYRWRILCHILDCNLSGGRLQQEWKTFIKLS